MRGQNLLLKVKLQTQQNQNNLLILNYIFDKKN